MADTPKLPPMPKYNQPTAKTTQEARMQGENAYYAGKPESVNPYEPSDDRHLSWNDGWLNAQEDDEQ